LGRLRRLGYFLKKKKHCRKRAGLTTSPQNVNIKGDEKMEEVKDENVSVIIFFNAGAVMSYTANSSDKAIKELLKHTSPVWLPEIDYDADDVRDKKIIVAITDKDLNTEIRTLGNFLHQAEEMKEQENMNDD
jgi:hypothetical protein